MSTNKMRALARDTRGLSTVEYVMLLVLIAAGSLQLWQKFGDVVTGKIKESTGEMAKLKVK